jgi:hypothetical protein
MPNKRFDKVSTFYSAPNATLRVTTIVSANGASCSIDGQPMIEISHESVQLGCVRFTPSALRAVVAIMDSGKRGLIQHGDYETADPNTRKEGEA